jgi:RNA polymerase sigma-70 factor (ECF subfamily)
MKTAAQIDLSDEQLIREYIKGDNNSLGMLYNRYYSKVYHKCFSFAGNQEDAFDLAQDVLMKTFSNIESFKGTSKFSSWLFSITSNHCISQTAKSKRECHLNTGFENNIIAEDPDEEEIEARYKREDMELHMNEYLVQLPEYDKKMLELKYLYNYSVKDLQREFNLSASAVKMRLLRARKKIEQIITTNIAA